MKLRHLKDQELLSQTKQLVQSERRLLTQVLHHLREVERRKLFSDLGCRSLFEYAVKELKYSEGQAGRRIQAMRLIKELPVVEKKIESGKLSLSNLSQAQTFFRELTKAEPEKQMNPTEKLEVLKSLENKSAREGQKVLLKIQPEAPLPKERERPVTETHTEVRFVMDEGLKLRLEELRSLLGAKGAKMSLAELIDYMTKVSLQEVRKAKFGKKRVQAEGSRPSGSDPKKPGVGRKDDSTPTSELQRVKNPRHVPRGIRYQVWTRDKGKCCQCGTQRNLNFDHVKPVGFGGGSKLDNIQLLCFCCNQRKAMKDYGVDHIRRHQVRGNI